MTTSAVAKKDISKLQRAIVDGLEDVKAQDIQVFDTEHLSALFERVVVASGTSNRQTKSLASSVCDAVREAGFPKPRVEGEGNGEWIIVDCGQAVVHIMQPTFRQYYNLEELWGEKPVRLKLGAAKPAVAEKAKARGERSASRRHQSEAFQCGQEGGRRGVPVQGAIEERCRQSRCKNDHCQDACAQIGCAQADCDGACGQTRGTGQETRCRQKNGGQTGCRQESCTCQKSGVYFPGFCRQDPGQESGGGRGQQNRSQGRRQEACTPQVLTESRLNRAPDCGCGGPARARLGANGLGGLCQTVSA